MNAISWPVLLQLATAVWWLFVGTMSMLAVILVIVNLRAWRDGPPS
ncbi:MAG TPA: hypothetical protein VD902_11140 [Symbiobacteriaceae bacterium]|nr:hypothetical protein [Symbiobacteriaceae bacterium]